MTIWPRSCGSPSASRCRAAGSCFSPRPCAARTCSTARPGWPRPARDTASASRRGSTCSSGAPGAASEGRLMGDRAVVLLSGGLDSATALAVARAEGYDCSTLSFDYGQRHARELESARRVAAAVGATEHLVLRLDLRAIGGSAITADIPVPKGRSEAAIASGIPMTYVPARNTIFLAHALAWAEVLGAQDIFIGVNILDR